MTEAVDYNKYHSDVKLENYLIENISCEPICESSDDEMQDNNHKKTGLSNLIFEEGDEYVEYKTSEKVKGDYDSDNDDDEEDFDDVDEILEETLFALQTLYFFISRIHSHSYISVYRALDKKTNKEVCIKIAVRHGKTVEPGSLPMEARILRCIQLGPDAHPGKSHCQNLLAYFSSPLTFVIVSDLYVETSFRKSLFGVHADIKEFMRQLLQAIDYLHSIKIISRDVKNSNILWDPHKKHLVLCDYDLSTFNNEKGHFVGLGTDGFMCPSVTAFLKPYKKSPPPYFEAVDIYSAGVVFGSLVNAKSENDVTEEVVQSWKTKLKRKKVNPTPCQQLLRSMLNGDPAKRPSAAECLKHAYFAQ